MKKAVTSRAEKGGDGLYQNRLLSYLDKQCPFKIIQIQPIRNQVYIVESENDEFILKGFSSYHRYKLQEAYTASLKNEGFSKTYSFLDDVKDPPLSFDQFFFGCMEYIPPSDEAFSYEEEKNRKEGLALLDDYHLVSAQLVQRYRTLLPQYKQLEKWQERTAQFIHHLPLIKYFVQKEMINEFLHWADWSIKGMNNETKFFQQGKQVILHGDVAHHNFLRAKDNHLYLLDFDLISVGAIQVDYLQYANRILPSIHWSFDELAQLAQLKPFLKEKGFLYALAFPTDIFREWNRAVRERLYGNPVKMRHILDLTVNHFQERQQFILKLKQEAES
ncbi:phosphotransferase [Cytobacillus purgationiresistens]|uniref:Thiamine kinase-like enzyme n=1 Tax=Cytobacillus purgationiresistens TaxID=863449 RepID=A0ABU0AGH1_9BACI|nr:phosphotransferase [Cytobacillus purgationiresistens]MDQ0269887.1 thiamine kinase-like enzyme [Cytobacillus purgationiresistens]